MLTPHLTTVQLLPGNTLPLLSYTEQKRQHNDITMFLLCQRNLKLQYTAFIGEALNVATYKKIKGTLQPKY